MKYLNLKGTKINNEIFFKLKDLKLKYLKKLTLSKTNITNLNNSEHVLDIENLKILKLKNLNVKSYELLNFIFLIHKNLENIYIDDNVKT